MKRKDISHDLIQLAKIYPFDKNKMDYFEAPAKFTSIFRIILIPIFVRVYLFTDNKKTSPGSSLRQELQMF